MKDARERSRNSRNSRCLFNLPICGPTVGMLALGLVFSGFAKQAFATIAATQFDDVTIQANVRYFGKSWGSAWGDFNGDGWPDLWVNRHGFGIPPALYLNNQDGTFTDIAESLAVFSGTADKHGAAWADFDNDGDQDLFQITGAVYGQGLEASLLYRNDYGSFKEVARDLGVDYPLARGRVPLWLDWNNDGLLDLFMGNFYRPHDEAPSRLFQQRKNSGFTDVSASVGLVSTAQLALNSVDNALLSDVTGDRKADLVLLSVWDPQWVYVYDMSTVPFVEKSTQLGLSPPPRGIRAMTIADFTGDLLTDIYLTTHGDKFELRSDRLFVKQGNGFVDATRNSGIRPSSSGRAVVNGDFDNDMDLDLYVVCTGRDANAPNILYDNLGNGTFVEVENAGGAAGPTSRGDGDTATATDYDRDGFLDLFLTNGYERDGGDRLLHNRPNGNHWIELALTGNLTNRDGIGASILLTAGGVTQLREQGGGMAAREQTGSQNDKVIHFGLGPNTVVDQITILWPSGTQQKITEIWGQPIRGDQMLHITEGSSTPPTPPPSPVALPETLLPPPGRTVPAGVKASYPAVDSWSRAAGETASGRAVSVSPPRQ